jgi:YtoQ family protein
MSDTIWTVYLSGEIHSDWRQRITRACEQAKLPIEFVSPNTNHGNSDDCGSVILGEEETPYWRDHKSAKINALRTRTLIERSDIVVVRFGDKYRQWNAAFDAGYAAAIDTPVITLRDDALTHPMKEIDAAALATCTEPDQVAEILGYVIEGRLNR